MTARPSARFIQPSKAGYSPSPKPWIAKSMMVVVPPWAAAMVPLSKSSAEVVPPNGMSRWVCTSMPPGITSLPFASTTVSACGGSPLPMVVMRPSSMRMSAS